MTKTLKDLEKIRDAAERRFCAVFAAVGHTRRELKAAEESARKAQADVDRAVR